MPEEFLSVPANATTNERGGGTKEDSVHIQFRVPAGVAAHVEAIVYAHKQLWQTNSDVWRTIAFLGIHTLSEIAPPKNSAIEILNLILRRAHNQRVQGQMSKVIEDLEELCLRSGGTEEGKVYAARQVWLAIKDLEKMPHGYWRTMLLGKLTDRLGHWTRYLPQADLLDFNKMRAAAVERGEDEEFEEGEGEGEGFENGVEVEGDEEI